MKASATTIEGVVEFAPQPFEDHRGIYLELYNEELYTAQGAPRFVQDDYSRSRQNVLRGLHGDGKTWKLISCLLGEIYFVVLDVRSNSATRGTWKSFVLSERNCRQVLVPPGCANGHLVLSASAIFHYKQSTYYEAGTQFSVRWDDPEYGIWWPIKTPILSRRDEKGGYVD